MRQNTPAAPWWTLWADAVDVDSYGVAMECQGFINGFRLALELCR